MPRHVFVHTALDPTARNQQLAAAWIWLDITHGTLRESPHHAAIRRDVRRFDQALRPEARLVLVEHGHAHLEAVADDIARATPALSVGSEQANGH